MYTRRFIADIRASSSLGDSLRSIVHVKYSLTDYSSMDLDAAREDAETTNMTNIFV